MQAQATAGIETVTISKSFVLGGTCTEKVFACITTLEIAPSSGIDGISAKYLKL